MDTPDPEDTVQGESEVEITDLDSPSKTGKVQGKYARWSQVSSYRVRVWMSIAIIACIALLVFTVVVNLSHVTKVAKVTIQPVRINYPVSLSVSDEICHATATNGVVTALRVSDGSLLWHYASRTPFSSLPAVADGVIYVGAFDGSIYVLRESDGTVLWRYQGGERGSASNTVTQGVIYLAFDATSGSGVNILASITALRANDGILLWSYIPHTDFRQLLPVMGDDIVLIALQDGSVDALRASSGSLLWHRAMNS